MLKWLKINVYEIRLKKSCSTKSNVKEIVFQIFLKISKVGKVQEKVYRRLHLAITFLKTCSWMYIWKDILRAALLTADDIKIAIGLIFLFSFETRNSDNSYFTYNSLDKFLNLIANLPCLAY